MSWVEGTRGKADMKNLLDEVVDITLATVEIAFLAVIHDSDSESDDDTPQIT